jgi:DNA-binding PadR family transcriptional regulator
MRRFGHYGRRHHRRHGFGGLPWAHPEDRLHWFGPPHGRHGRGGPPRGPWGDEGWGDDEGPRRRQRRGDIRYALLALLAEQPRHGYELIKELEERSGGFYRPSPGSVYPTLQLLEDEGYATSESVAGKRVYTITQAGRELLAANPQPPFNAGQAEAEAGHGGDARQQLHALREQAAALAASVAQAARHGSDEQRQAVTRLLDQTRREVYRILSQTNDASSASKEA